jgi:hypothetical protein
MWASQDGGSRFGDLRIWVVGRIFGQGMLGPYDNCLSWFWKSSLDRRNLLVELIVLFAECSLNISIEMGKLLEIVLRLCLAQVI